jgi:hypothetical protein
LIPFGSKTKLTLTEVCLKNVGERVKNLPKDPSPLFLAEAFICLLFAIPGEKRVNMPDHTLNRRGEFDSLVNEAQEFFEEAANQPIGVSRIQEFSWLHFSLAQRMRADDLRRGSVYRSRP